MSTTAPQPATTPIPVQLSEPEFEPFILPHLSMPKRGPKCKLGYYRDCSKATGFIQPVHDEVMQGFVDGLRRGLHATCPAPDAHGSARASAPGRHSFASCDSAGCPAPRHSRWRAAACHRETSTPFPGWAKRAS